jgi:hypothetical protein
MKGFKQCLNCQKLSGGLTISRHAIDLNRYVRMYGGVETDPPGYPRASCLGGGGLSKQLGGSTPNPPAIQTLGLNVNPDNFLCLFLHCCLHYLD